MLTTGILGFCSLFFRGWGWSGFWKRASPQDTHHRHVRCRHHHWEDYRLFLVAPATNTPHHIDFSNGLLGFAPLLTRRMHVCRNNMHEGSYCPKDVRSMGR